jgi:hypothetical protein
MTDDETGLHRVFAADDVQVCTADGGESDANDRLASGGARTLDFLYSELTLTSEDIGSHAHFGSTFRTRRVSSSTCELHV